MFSVLAKFHEYFLNFLDFNVHGGMIRAKTRMGTYQHFCHECKWHWQTGDVFSNILVSYLHFSDLVWISYEISKVTVKRSKGKSTRRPKWVGQNCWLLEIRGNPVEWDITRGIKPIIPILKLTVLCGQVIMILPCSSSLYRRTCIIVQRHCMDKAAIVHEIMRGKTPWALPPIKLLILML